MILYRLLCTLFFGTTLVRAQLDTMLVYDVRSKETHIVLAGFVDSITSFDNTQWNYGSASGFANLILQPPSDTFPGAGFTDYKPAHSLLPVSDYPARVAVKLFRFIGDSLKQVCSGTMVAANLVLTSSHCIYNFFDTSSTRYFADSILAIPAYDNGMEQSEFGSSISKAYVIPKQELDHFMSQDIALVQLREPIGLKTGWAGVAFADGNAYFQNKVFHKFSYPGTVDPSDSSRVFNGDTLYYNYGTLDLIDDTFLGYNIWAVPGQSGSSLLYTDNIKFWAVGTCSWGHDSQHTRLTRGTFYAFKGIIDGVQDGVSRNRVRPLGYALMNPYPNPFNPKTVISYQLPVKSYLTLKVYDILGREVTTLVNEVKPAGSYSVQWTAHGMPSGVYFCRLQAGPFVDTKKLILSK
jgi:V8-like Glu-specific endopeptidase